MPTCVYETLPKSEQEVAETAPGWDVPADQTNGQTSLPGVSETAALIEVPAPLGDYEIVSNSDQLDSMIEKLRESGEFAFDTETSGLDSMTSDLVGLELELKQVSDMS